MTVKKLLPVLLASSTVDYQTARNLLIAQGVDLEQTKHPLLSRLQQGQPPIPGQITSILLALKVVFETLRDATQLDRELACSLHNLSIGSRQYFNAGESVGVEWPPLLEEDLMRISAAVKSIFMDQWYEN